MGVEKKSQSDKFKDLAREVEANEDEAAFDEKLRHLRPKDRKPPKERR
ncbi:hypothetical protein [Roseitranquillus sediminis]|nr:hypothetical protein [Roseitranquillus sediminis]MBM9594469.1 hypothetical protein [Roseitranquillus sediminis]